MYGLCTFCFTDKLENIKWEMSKIKLNVEKIFMVKKWFKSIVFVLLFNPESVAKMSLENFRIHLCTSLIKSFR